MPGTITVRQRRGATTWVATFVGAAGEFHDNGFTEQQAVDRLRANLAELGIEAPATHTSDPQPEKVLSIRKRVEDG